MEIKDQVRNKIKYHSQTDFTAILQSSCLNTLSATLNFMSGGLRVMGHCTEYNGLVKTGSNMCSEKYNYKLTAT